MKVNMSEWHRLYESLEFQERQAYEVCRRVRGVQPLVPARDARLYQAMAELQPGGCLYRASFAYHLQATRQRSLRFFDGKTLMSLGFAHDGKPVVGIGPMGNDGPGVCRGFGQRLQREGLPFYVKKILPHEVDAYTAVGFTPVDYASEFAPDELPDDVHPEVLIDVPGFSYEASGEKPAQVRQQIRKLYPGAPAGALTRHDREVTPGQEETDSLEHVAVAGDLISTLRSLWLHKLEMKHFVTDWSRQRAARLGGDPRTYAAAYWPIITNLEHLPQGVITIGRDLESGSMVGVLVADRLSDNASAVSVNLADIRYQGLAETLIATTIYGMKSVYRGLRKRALNLGGSETESLHQFKRKFTPNVELPMRYLKFVGQ